MERLTLEKLKAQKKVVANLESIKGGDTDACHYTPSKTTGGGSGVVE